MKNGNFTFGGLIFFILIVIAVLNEIGKAGASDGVMKFFIVIGLIVIIVAIFFYNVFKQ